MSHLQVSTETHNSDFQLMESGLLQLRRIHNFRQSTRLLEAYTHLWGWAVGNFPEGKLHVHRRRMKVPLNGRCLIVVPPFNLIEWSIEPVHIQWEGFLTTAELP